LGEIQLKRINRIRQKKEQDLRKKLPTYLKQTDKLQSFQVLFFETETVYEM